MKIQTIMRQYEAALVTLSIIKETAPMAYKQLKETLLARPSLQKDQEVALRAMFKDVEEWNGGLQGKYPQYPQMKN